LDLVEGRPAPVYSLNTLDVFLRPTSQVTANSIDDPERCFSCRDEFKAAEEIWRFQWPFSCFYHILSAFEAVSGLPIERRDACRLCKHL
jgi:hypothetical protein